MNANNHYKYIEVGKLTDYLETLTYKEKVEFKKAVCLRLKIKRTTFANWLSMACRMPKEARQAIEYEAGELIFTDYD